MTKDTDATHILASDHRAIEHLFAQFEVASDSDRKNDLAARICTEFKIHARIEEEVFYPALRGKIDASLLDEALVEHDGARMLIDEIEASSAVDSFFDAKLMILKDEIEYHMKEEETERDNMFQQARAADVDLDALGERILARKAELARQTDATALPPVLTVTT